MATMALTAPAEKPLGEMNTTPLIDVMLVMLIMFLITLPIQTHAVSIDLPIDGGHQVLGLENRITIDRGGQSYWNGEQVNQPQLAQLLREAQLLQPDPSLLLHPDAEAPYVIVDQVLALVRRTGTESIAFIGNEQHARAF